MSTGIRLAIHRPEPRQRSLVWPLADQKARQDLISLAAKKVDIVEGVHRDYFAPLPNRGKLVLSLPRTSNAVAHRQEVSQRPTIDHMCIVAIQNSNLCIISFEYFSHTSILPNYNGVHQGNTELF